MRRMPRLAVLLALLFGLAGCSANPTSSPEYVALEDEIEVLRSEVAAGESEIASLAEQLSEMSPTLAETESSTEALVERWIAALEDEDLDALVPLYSEDVIWKDQALGDHFEGHSGIRRGWGIFVLEGFEFREISAVAVGDSSAAVRWKMSGARSPFTGGAWESTGISVLEISGDEITAETVYYDSRDIR